MALPLRLEDDARFENFFVSTANQLAFQALQAFLDDNEPYLYLWGSQGVGKTHLLQACCHHARDVQRRIFYLSLQDYQQLTPEILEGVETCDLVCIDDIDFAVGKPAWEEALFYSYNRLQAAKVKLLIASTQAAKALAVQLADLHSRLNQAVIFHLHGLNEAELIQALQFRAKQRGLSFDVGVGEFLLKRWPRDSRALFSALECLDRASLTAQRRLTIPFVKQTLDL